MVRAGVLETATTIRAVGAVEAFGAFGAFGPARTIRTIATLEAVAAVVSVGTLAADVPLVATALERTHLVPAVAAATAVTGLALDPLRGMLAGAFVAPFVPAVVAELA